MARTVLNPALRMLSGNISDFTYRCYADGRVFVAKAPRRDPNRKPSPSQQAYRQRFKDASARYKRLLQDPATRAAYVCLLAAAGPRARLHALVIGDIMTPPQITAVDVSKYHGAVGDPIIVMAQDNVAVARATVTIHDRTNAQVLEVLEHLPAPEHLAKTVAWLVTTKTPAPTGHTLEIRVSVYDLAGNQAEACQAI